MLESYWKSGWMITCVCVCVCVYYYRWWTAYPHCCSLPHSARHIVHRTSHRPFDRDSSPSHRTLAVKSASSIAFGSPLSTCSLFSSTEFAHSAAGCGGCWTITKTPWDLPSFHLPHHPCKLPCPQTALDQSPQSLCQDNLVAVKCQRMAKLQKDSDYFWKLLQ